MIIATAGHVDHGKTSLVKALTGTNTDRLPEEKKRGLTIDIGFAYLKTKTDEKLAFIDVPGHEKFVRNTIAGVGMADIALLIVAADDGLMPQSLEHLAILRLMGVVNIIPVVSKTDLVDSARALEVQEQVRSVLNQAGCPEHDIHALAVTDKPKVASLKTHITQLASQQPVRAMRGYFRLAIDRSFTLDGSGTVATGTVISGQIEKEESVTLISDGAASGKSARVRSIHAQNTSASETKAGQRCALNLSGELHKSVLQRGGWLTTNPSFQSTRLVDVVITPAMFSDLNYLSTRSDATKSGKRGGELRHWTPAHFHIGTADIPCRIALLAGSSLAPGERGLARLICDKDFVAVHGDRFVLRDQSARKTIAGGTVLDPYPPRRGRGKPQRLRELQAMDAETPSQAIANMIELSESGVKLPRCAQQFNLQPQEIEALTVQQDLVVIGMNWAVTQAQAVDLKDRIKQVLHQFHQDNPDQLGIDSITIRRLCSMSIDLPVFEYFLHELISCSEVARNATIYRLSEHEASLSAANQLSWNLVSSRMESAGYTPPRVVEISEALSKTADETYQVLNHFVSHGKIIKVTDNRYFLPETLLQLASMAEDLSNKDALSVAEFRTHSGIGRNLVVELLEYFDRIRFTQRIGNQRSVLMSADELF